MGHNVVEKSRYGHSSIKEAYLMGVKTLKTVILLLTLTILASSMIGIVDASHLKYSELVNVSIEDFATSMANNVSALVRDIESANEVHDYDTIVKRFDLIDKNYSLNFELGIAFQDAGLWEKSDSLSSATDPIFTNVFFAGTHIREIYEDARKRVDEREAEIAEQEHERLMNEVRNATLAANQISSASNSTPNNGFGNYTLEGREDVRVVVKKGTDVVHMMDMEELPTEYGYTKDSAQYTITSTGNNIKGYIDYTLDGYVIVVQPRKSSLTKGELIVILDTFQRVE